MLSRRAFLFLSLLALLAAFGYGLVQLFNLRFAAGDVYPPYSSLRGDPLGCKVYFESLERLEDTHVIRHKQSVEKLPEGAATLFVFGLAWNEMSARPDEFKALEMFVRGGGRLVVALYPELNKPRGFVSGLGTNRPAFRNPLRDDGDSDQPSVNLRVEWGLGLEHVPIRREGAMFSLVDATRTGPAPVPANLSWHSSLVFTNLDSAWRIIYTRGGNDPVLIERTYGSGSLVFATDSYFVSNEAMREERAPDLLTWLAGRNREIIFDETHLGIIEQAGIAVLARRYRLHGGVLALVALALLFIWKNSASFVPRGDDRQRPAPVLGRESAAGFENLLRRSVAPRDLLQASLDEWHKAGRLDGRQSDLRREKIRAVVEAYNAAEKPNIVDAYREITRILDHKK